MKLLKRLPDEQVRFMVGSVRMVLIVLEKYFQVAGNSGHFPREYPKTFLNIFNSVQNSGNIP
jgi:hypothetical protein